jgi:ComF family protein
MLSRLRHWSQHLPQQIGQQIAQQMAQHIQEPLRHQLQQLQLHRHARAAVALLPSCCALCGCGTDASEGTKGTGEASAADNAGLCRHCRQRYLGIRQARCVQCALPLPPTSLQADCAIGGICDICTRQAPAFDATIAAVDYAPPMDQLVLGLKFGNQLSLAALFARLLRDAMLHAPGPQASLPTLLCAVPLGRRRLTERGYNQALEIAKPLSRSLGIALDAHLTARVRETAAQAQLHPDQRHHNIRNGFIVTSRAQQRVEGQHIGVVDDVLTTGETLNEMAATLKRFGAVRVTNLVFARTPAHQPTGIV